ncbi:hypothetical protein BST61_g5628 [Cercospora zeina]
MPCPQLLVVFSSQDILPTSSHPTGWYLPEFAHPSYKLAEHVDVTVASPKGCSSPVDPYSVESTKGDESSQRFYSEKKSLFEETPPLASFLGRSGDDHAIFYVGGQGPMFDLATDTASHALVRECNENDKIVSAVCHGPAALADVKLSDGSCLVFCRTRKRRCCNSRRCLPCSRRGVTGPRLVNSSNLAASLGCFS